MAAGEMAAKAGGGRRASKVAAISEEKMSAGSGVWRSNGISESRQP
jgi:hypothetical protein